jgi:hypothetical protein
LVKGGHGRFRRIAGVGAAVKVNTLPSWLQASPNKDEKRGVLLFILKMSELFLSSWNLKADKSLSSIKVL